MSSFLLLLDVCIKLASASAHFWWSSNPSKKRCIGKNERNCVIQKRKVCGIEFRTIFELNLALLAKQFWRLVQFPDSLLASVLCRKYYRLSLPLRTVANDSPSYVWKILIVAWPLLTSWILQKNSL